jgi:hypothetical protein
MKTRSARAVALSPAALRDSARPANIDHGRNADFSTIRTGARVKPVENEKRIDRAVDRPFRKWEKMAAK